MLKSSHPSPVRIRISPNFGRDLTRNQYHVVSRVDGGWAVYRYRARRAARVFDAKTDALDFARAIARKNRSELVIHREDATTESRESFA